HAWNHSIDWATTTVTPRLTPRAKPGSVRPRKTATSAAPGATQTNASTAANRSPSGARRATNNGAATQAATAIHASARSAALGAGEQLLGKRRAEPDSVAINLVPEPRLAVSMGMPDDRARLVGHGVTIPQQANVEVEILTTRRRRSGT